MDVQDFQLLSVLGRTRNITHAADELYITQSSVSKRIRQMERELGVTLFLRSRQGITLTPAGEIVLQHTGHIIHELELMQQNLVTVSGTVAGTLRAGISINYAMYRLADQLADYNQLYPAVDTQIITANSQKIYSMLLGGQIDVAILRGEHSEWRGQRILLERERVCAIVGPQDAGRPLQELPQINRQADVDMEREITQWLRENKIRSSKRRIQVNSTSTCVTMVERGLGWGIVPEICLKDFKGERRPLFFANGEPLMRSTYLLFTPQALELPQVCTFIDCIRQHEEKWQKGQNDHV
ncbi:MAG: LysR family transcriptional regulator [Selenomonas sp.]|uniref:LysR family transcriptional regulator n=1 Tax=Selenomonas sp. TaxID=2053611 RepID=UPI0025F36A7F|nr:LysR family transcriptional regulator [Selenomonas sp.]MCR5758240.1 LysR family transcriptional regulator [Selenomonas sp.]